MKQTKYGRVFKSIRPEKNRVLNIVSNRKGMELMQAMGLMVVCLVLAGAVYLAANNSMSDHMASAGNALTSIYDYVSVIDDAEEEGDGAEVTPVDKVAMAYDSQRLGGQIASYYGTKAEVDAAQETANDAMELAIEANNNAAAAQNAANTASSNAIATYTHTTGAITGSGVNGKFKATVTQTLTSIKVNGTAYTVKCGADSEIELSSGSWYFFMLDESAKTINFSAGGGLTNSKLAAATATEADVLAGKTFYSGDKTLKTGTLVGGLYHSLASLGTSNCTAVTLPAGTYRYLYTVQLAAYPGIQSANVKIYAGGSAVVNYSGLDYYYSPAGNMNMYRKAYSNTFTLTEAKSVYISLTLNTTEGTSGYNWNGISSCAIWRES